MVELRFGKALLVLLVAAALLAPVAMAQSAVSGVVVGLGLRDFLMNQKAVLVQMGPVISAIMFVIAGMIYAFGQLQPAEARGKYQAWAMGLIVGGVVVGALSVSADFLAGIVGGFLK